MPPLYSAADYLAAFQRLMPRGRVWPRDLGSVQALFLDGLSPSYARNHLAANQLLIDAFPATAVQLLGEWEETLGLPDPCEGPAPSLQARQAQVVARFTGLGGQSIGYLAAAAEAVGYEVTLTEFAPARASLMRAGDRCRGPDWAFALLVSSAAVTNVTYFRASLSAADEPLSSYGNAPLECRLREIAPAHVVLIFAYDAPLGVMILGQNPLGVDTSNL